ncbi:MAG: DUF222 domain-containing protein [Acidimicrobiia bacterium]|nr:DUF222 domain-containing protein [Acidimicrobiia bacterium]
MTADHLPFGILVKQMVAAVADVSAGDLDTAVEPELADLLVDLMGAGTQLEAVTAHVAARVDASKIWTNDGSKSCGAWLGRAAHRDGAECAAVVRRGRQLRTMELVDAAHTAGRLSSRHVVLLATAAGKVPEHFATDEEWLVARAVELSYADFVKLVNHWIHWAAPDDAEDDALKRYRNRKLNLSTGLDGTGMLDVEFEPIGYAIFTEALRRIEHELWAADWAEARSRLGNTASQADLWRSNAQRRYDALIEMARRSAAMPTGARKPVPLVTVHVDHPTLTGRICELSNGTQITPGEILPLLVEADIERAVFDTKSRVIDLGRTSRLFVAGTRRAVEIRDRHCTHHTGCQVPAEQCDIDHIEPWEHGGPTNHNNAQARCPKHHPGRHRKNPPKRKHSGERGSAVNGSGDRSSGDRSSGDRDSGDRDSGDAGDDDDGDHPAA